MMAAASGNIAIYRNPLFNKENSGSPREQASEVFSGGCVKLGIMICFTDFPEPAVPSLKGATGRCSSGPTLCFRGHRKNDPDALRTGFLRHRQPHREGTKRRG